MDHELHQGAREDAGREYLLGTGPPNSPRATTDELIGTNPDPPAHTIAQLLDQYRAATNDNERTELAVSITEGLLHVVSKRRSYLPGASSLTDFL